MSKDITAFFKGRVGVAESVYQHDYGRVINLDGVDLPASFDAWFETQGSETAIPVVGASTYHDNRVAIPNSCLEHAGKVTLHIPLHEGTNDSEVEYTVTFRVIGRATPVDDGTPEEQSALSQAIALLQHVPSQIEDYFEAHIVPAVLQDVNDWLDEHPEATTTVQDGSLTEAKFTSALKKSAIKDYVTPEMYGAVGDGATDDTRALEECLRSGKSVLGLNTYFVTSSIAITLSTDAAVFINKVKASMPGSIFKILGGAYSIFHIRELENLAGKGFSFDSTSNDSIVESCDIVFDRIHTKGTCCELNNSKGVLDSLIGGGFWLSDTGYGFHAVNKTSYIGQCKVYVRRITALANYAIYLSSELGPLTGLDFGYCSLEGSDAGIRMDYGPQTFEPVYGNFRVNENTAANKVALKVNGDLTKALGKSRLAFDYIRVRSIDLSGITKAQELNLREPIDIYGTILSNSTGVILTDKMSVRNGGLVFKPTTSRSQDVRTVAAAAALQTYWESYYATSRVATNSDVNEIVMPSFWDGSPFPLQVAVETTVKFYYTAEDFASIILAAGRHTLMMAFDGTGKATLYMIA